MKIKHILLSLFLSLLNIQAFASSGYFNPYCQLNGVLHGPHIKKEEEFKMLLEPTRTPNFQAISAVIGAIIVAPTEVLKDPSCKISKYTKQLVDYYKEHKIKITENDQNIADILDFIQKRLEKLDSLSSETEGNAQNEL